ncbi:putative nucleobase-ascorbate transporter 10 [Cucumis melo var. makuwa]|uniref:Nucleobase-ascorbate transporter 10 n=1 Tax=Cucumis melo var. makuwa TaxID=1194695 RepID=A0A5A7SS46_CUCMM|nr:putative nucleobase-ascorbate transporter 10 [Cucumis melo var. makuwa]
MFHSSNFAVSAAALSITVSISLSVPLSRRLHLCTHIAAPSKFAAPDFFDLPNSADVKALELRIGSGGSHQNISESFKALAATVNAENTTVEVALFSRACSFISPLFDCLGIAFKFAEMDCCNGCGNPRLTWKRKNRKNYVAATTTTIVPRAQPVPATTVVTPHVLQTLLCLPPPSGVLFFNHVHVQPSPPPSPSAFISQAPICQIYNILKKIEYPPYIGEEDRCEATFHEDPSWNPPLLFLRRGWWSSAASSFRLKQRKMAADDDLEDTATSPPHPSIVSKYLPHLLKTKKPIYDQYSVLFSIVIIWLYAQLLTSSTVYNHKPATTQKSCRTDQVGLLSTAPWIYIPYPFQWGGPTFNAGEAFAMMAASAVSLFESTGTFFAASRYGSATPVPASIISRGSGWLGVGVLLNDMFGSVTGTCASVENDGLLALTRVGSKRVIQISAGFMIFFSVFGKFGALFASIPLPIIATLYCVFFGYVSSGLDFLQFCNLNSFRTKFILGTSFFLGLSIPQYFREYYHRDLNPSEHIYSGQGWLPSLHPLMENLKKSVIKMAYSRDHADLSHLHRSFIPFLYMASSLYKLALSLRHYFYLYGILRKHRSRLTRSQQIWLIILPIPSLDVVFCWVSKWQFGGMIELLEL